MIDNAYGHGTDVTILAYTKLLKVDYNIVLIHQVPRSSYTNLIDLGVWRSLQDQVEKVHFMRRTDIDTLANSVYKTWALHGNASGLDNVIEKVWMYLKMYWCLL